MENKFDMFEKWLDNLSSFQLPDWDKLPDVDLYMDQIVTYLEGKLSFLKEEKIVTPFMVNNYVKGGVLPPPTKKKYNREQIASLFIICILKRTISLNDIATILKIDEEHNQTKDAIYIEFKQLYDFTIQFTHQHGLEILQEMRQRADEDDEKSVEYQLSNIALIFASFAEICRLISLTIIEEIQDEPRSKRKDVQAERNKAKKFAQMFFQKEEKKKKKRK